MHPKKFRESLLRTVVCALPGPRPRVRRESKQHTSGLSRHWPFTDGHKHVTAVSRRRLISLPSKKTASIHLPA